MSSEDMQLVRILSTSRAVFFDFDGPLCDVFAGLPAPRVARDLELILGEFVSSDDPLQILRSAVRRDAGTVRAVDDALISAEVAAVRTSVATPGGIEALNSCLALGATVGVVSNNSADSVLAFLEMQRLVKDIRPVIGRSYMHPERMKPNPWPLLRAFSESGKSAVESVFIGDSLTDVEVAAAVGVPCIAYANKPGKRAEFEAAGVVVIDSMWEVAAAADTAYRRRLGPQ